MSVYFKYIPKVKYNGRLAVDITRRSNLVEDIFIDPYILLPYTVNQDDRPEDIAFYYYRKSELVWLIYYANNIIDPYSQWPLTQSDFYGMLKKKYKAQSGLTGNAIIQWTQNTTITENILYYKNINDPQLTINVDTYNLNQKIIQGDWDPVRIYEYESVTNDNKRNISLIDSRYVNTFVKQLEETMNE
jgi:antitoxin component YwqK of YwqJK toxin-antitoxin module